VPFRISLKAAELPALVVPEKPWVSPSLRTAPHRTVTVGVGILLVRRVGVDIHLVRVCCVRECVLLIGTQFSDLYTAVDIDKID
jgi:hypothetical protein